jgi:citrate synthase
LATHRFGYRIYKNYDPSARIIKWTADRVFEVTRRNPKLYIALELERLAPEDEYFITRKLYPKMDFNSEIIYQAMGFKPEMSTVLFAIPRTVGWFWRSARRCWRIRSRRSPGHGFRHFVPLKRRVGQPAAAI